MRRPATSGRVEQEQLLISRVAQGISSQRYRLLALNLARHFLKITFVLCLGIIAACMIEQGVFVAELVFSACAALLLFSLVTYVAELKLAEVEAEAARTILDRARSVLVAAPAREAESMPRGKTIAQLQRHPVAVARLCVSHWLARMNMAVMPMFVAAAIALVSWQAALALILGTPVMISFFALVGGKIHEKAQAQEKSFGRLSTQFSDRIRTLPTILANQAFAREDAKLGERMQNYSSRTLSTLSVAFLNSAILDFFSSLSIAMLAVFLGLGHLGLAQLPGFYDLALWQSLAILILAPEYFAPLRRFAEQYHLKAEGDAAAEALGWVLKSDGSDDAASPPMRHAGAKGLVLQFAGPVADFTLPEQGLVVLAGPSGGGKSMLLKTLAGVERPVRGATGLPTGVSGPVAWASVDTFIPGGTLEEIVSRGRQAEAADVHRIAAALDLLDARYLPGGLNAQVTEGGENLSGGQRMRIALARGLMGGGPLLCDEPTAKIDPKTAGRIRQELAQAAETRLVIAATHDPALIELADMCIDVSAASNGREMVA
ncbi:MAG: ATP-binding cassette domain-containing protein [Hyphomicrobiales bacterium]|nr:ATP-binding cassette domain-containing protein [Hyphomicrobiales bacterium]